MPENTTCPSMLDEIELRQTELLRQLDELNDRVEKTLREQNSARGSAS